MALTLVAMFLLNGLLNRFDPIQANTDRLNFILAREDDGTVGAMGFKSIATHLNAKNVRPRDAPALFGRRDDPHFAR